VSGGTVAIAAATGEVSCSSSAACVGGLNSGSGPGGKFSSARGNGLAAESAGAGGAAIRAHWNGPSRDHGYGLWAGAPAGSQAAHFAGDVTIDGNLHITGIVTGAPRPQPGRACASTPAPARRAAPTARAGR
jgi:hypothetical protein